MFKVSDGNNGPFRQQFPIGCLLATAGAFRSGFFYSNGQIHFLNILTFIVLIPILFVVGGIIDATFFTRRKLKSSLAKQRDCSVGSAVNTADDSSSGGN